MFSQFCKPCFGFTGYNNNNNDVIMYTVIIITDFGMTSAHIIPTGSRCLGGNSEVGLNRNGVVETNDYVANLALYYIVLKPFKRLRRRRWWQRNGPRRVD